MTRDNQEIKLPDSKDSQEIELADGWATLYLGDCMEVLSHIPDNSIDSVVTDPPAGISMMGKNWDSDKGGRDNWIAWMTQVAEECLRVLKPGGHALVWALPRTSHWTATAWEDAGFELRDRISYVFGTGFPKSLDVSKAIDAQTMVDCPHCNGTGWVLPTPEDAVNRWAMQNHISFEEAVLVLQVACPHCKGSGQTKGAEREVVRRMPPGSGPLKTGHVNRSGGGMSIGTERSPEIKITAPATPEAEYWDGWGTALKPAIEDWHVCRKPMIGTVAENVLTWGVGGLNIDGARVETGKPIPAHHGTNGAAGRTFGERREYEPGSSGTVFQNKGRWPAHLILDGSEEVVGLFPSSKGQMAPVGPRNGDKTSVNTYGDYGPRQQFDPRNDDGSAARFFPTCPLDDSGADLSRLYYGSKASSTDRNEGCENLEVRAKVWNGQSDESSQEMGEVEARWTTKTRNFHPTVKSTDLMRWLCHLVTPPSALVLDPFMGSGSTGKAAVLEGYRFVGIEMDPDYMQIAEARISWALAQPRQIPLFDDTEL
jgi:DNA modification methylase